MSRHDNRCMWHRTSVPAHVRNDSFFQAGCPQCEAKRAAGKVTGSEPPPPTARDYIRQAHAMKSRAWVAQARASR